MERSFCLLLFVGVIASVASCSSSSTPSSAEQPASTDQQPGDLPPIDPAPYPNSGSGVSSAWQGVRLQEDCSYYPYCPTRQGFELFNNTTFFFGESSISGGSIATEDMYRLIPFAEAVASQAQSNSLECSSFEPPLEISSLTLTIDLPVEGVRTVYVINRDDKKICYRGDLQLVNQLYGAMNQLATKYQLTPQP